MRNRLLPRSSEAEPQKREGIMLTRDKDLRRRGDELFDGKKNIQSNKQAEPTEPK